MAYPDKQGKHAQTADKYYIGLAGSQGEHRAHQRCHIEGRPGNCLQGGQGLMTLHYAEQGEYQGKAEAVQADLPKNPAQRRIAERRAGRCSSAFALTPYLHLVHHGVLPYALALLAKGSQVGGQHAKDQRNEQAARLRQIKESAQGKEQ